MNVCFRRYRHGQWPLSITLTLVFIKSSIAWAGHGENGDPTAPLHEWSITELHRLENLYLKALPSPPADVSNAYSTNPQAAQLGRALFFDVRLSRNGRVSCATCHVPARNFTDGQPLAKGIHVLDKRTPTLVGAAYNTWYFWDGRKDSLWSQALGPLESRDEHGISRTRVVQIIASTYATEYKQIFSNDKLPDHPENYSENAQPSQEDSVALAEWQKIPESERRAINRVFVNAGKAIGAYVRTILPGWSRFDDYVQAALEGDMTTMRSTLSPAETRGLRMFIGNAGCINCHNGPLLSNGHFHVVDSSDEPGRAAAIARVLDDPFNCLGEFSDAAPKDCSMLKFMDTQKESYRGAFKTPTLRCGPNQTHYLHAGQAHTLAEVLIRYRENAAITDTKTDLEHTRLTDSDIIELALFLETLCAPYTILNGDEQHHGNPNSVDISTPPHRANYSIRH